eukprot:COSAG02_NODE_2407_length_8929_cov_50.486154_3_plen_1720_part_01
MPIQKPRVKDPKPNVPCPCGSGKKYKKCCKLKHDKNRAVATSRKPDRLDTAEMLYRDSKYLEAEAEIQTVLFNAREDDMVLRARCKMLRGQIKYRQAGCRGVLLPKEQLRAALDLLGEAEQMLPEDECKYRSAVLNHKGMVLNQLKENTALPTLERALEIYTTRKVDAGMEPMIRSNLADALTAAGRHNDAISHLRQAIQQNGGDRASSNGVRHAKLAGLYETIAQKSHSCSVEPGVILMTSPDEIKCMQYATLEYEHAVESLQSPPAMKCEWHRSLSLLYGAQACAPPVDCDVVDFFSQEYFDKALVQLKLGIKAAKGVTGMRANYARDFRVEVCEKLLEQMLKLMLLVKRSKRGDDVGLPPVAATDDPELLREQKRCRQLTKNVDRIMTLVKDDKASLCRFECLAGGLMVQVCVAAGNYQDAAPHGERFCKSLREGAEVDNDHIISSRHSLCQVYQMLNRYEDAKEQADEMLKESEGDCSHALIFALEDVASSYRRTGENSYALKCQERLLSHLADILEKISTIQRAVPGRVPESIVCTIKQQRAVALNNKGDILRHLGHLSEAAEFFEQAADLAKELDYKRLENAARSNLAIVRSHTDGPAEVLPVLLKQLKQCDEAMELIKCHSNLGQEYMRLNKRDDMNHHYELALKKARACGQAGREHEAEILMLMGNACIYTNDTNVDLKRGSEFYDQALGIIANVPGATSLEAKIIGNRANALTQKLIRAWNDREQEFTYILVLCIECEACHTDAIRRAKKLGDRELIIEREASYADYVDFCTKVGISHPRDPVQLAEDALKKTMPGSTTRADVLQNLADICLSYGQLEDAAKHAADCIDILTAHRGGLADDHKVSVFAHKHSKAFDIRIHCLVQLDQHEEALEAAERSRSTALLDLVADSRSGLDVGDRVAIHSLTGAPQHNGKLGTVRSFASEKDRYSVELDGGEKNAKPLGVKPANLTYCEGKVWSCQESSDLVKNLNAELVYYYIDKAMRALYIWVIDRKGEVHFEQQRFGSKGIPTVDALIGAFGSWRSYGCITASADRGNPVPKSLSEKEEKRQLTEVRSTLDGLSKLLVEPIRHLLTPMGQVVFFPHNELALVPFAALRSTDGTVQTRHLVDDFTIQIGLSLRLMAIAQDSAKTCENVSGGDALVVGYPQTDTVCAKPRLSTQNGAVVMDGWTEQSVPPLPSAIREAREVSQLLGCTALIGESATKAAVLERLKSASVVHLATHGDVDALGPRLLLHGKAEQSTHSDQFLRVEDIMACKPLPPQLVVLAACNSGRGDLVAGEGVMGLARAFLAAGALGVVISLWKLPDRLTSTLMNRLYTKLVETDEDVAVDVGNALRWAMRDTETELQCNSNTLVSEQLLGGLLLLGAGQVWLNVRQGLDGERYGQSRPPMEETALWRSFDNNKGQLERMACEALGFVYTFKGKDMAVGNGLYTKSFNGKLYQFLTEGPDGAVQAIFGTDEDRCERYHEVWGLTGSVVRQAQKVSPGQRARALSCLDSSIRQRESQTRDRGHENMLQALQTCYGAIRAMDEPDKELTVQKTSTARPSEPANIFELLCNSIDDSASESSSDDETGDEANDDPALRLLDSIKKEQYISQGKPYGNDATRGDGDSMGALRKRDASCIEDLPLLWLPSAEEQAQLSIAVDKKVKRTKRKTGKKIRRLPCCDGQYRCKYPSADTCPKCCKEGYAPSQLRTAYKQHLRSRAKTEILDRIK